MYAMQFRRDACPHSATSNQFVPFVRYAYPLRYTAIPCRAATTLYYSNAYRVSAFPPQVHSGHIISLLCRFESLRRLTSPMRYHAKPCQRASLLNLSNAPLNLVYALPFPHLALLHPRRYDMQCLISALPCLFVSSPVISNAICALPRQSVPHSAVTVLLTSPPSLLCTMLNITTLCSALS